MRRALRKALQRRDAGFTLVEVMTACVILGILAASVLALILQTQSQNVINRNRVAASNLAAREMDLVRDEFHRGDNAPVAIANMGMVVNPHQLDGSTPGDPAAHPLVMNGTAFTVTRTVEWNLIGEGKSACEGGDLVQYPTLGVTVSVTWPNMGSVKPVVSTAQMAPNKGFGIQATDSFVAVRVQDQNGHDLSGRTVQVTGGGTTKTWPTDPSGCAVVEVSPAATGTDYTASVVDPGYVDITNTPNPSKPVGKLGRGQLAANVSFQVAEAGTIHVDLVDSTGDPVLTPPAGAVISLVPSESAGASDTIEVPITGPSVDVGNLWPTVYGAYYGQMPPDSYESAELAPGGRLDLRATLILADVRLTGLAPGATVYGHTDGTATCTGTTLVGTTGADGTLTLHEPPADWTFSAALPGVACSPGPQATLQPGDNGTITWGYSTLTVTGAPTGSTVYAIEASQVTNATTCPPATTSAAQVVPATGLQVAAGTWNIWATSGASCAKPTAQSSVVVAYGQNRSVDWGSHQVTLTVTGITPVYATADNTGSSKHPSYTYKYSWPNIVVTQTAVANLQCSSNGIKVKNTSTYLNSLIPSTSTVTGGSSSTIPSTTTTATSQLQEGTWNIVVNDPTGRKWTSSTCKVVGTAVSVTSFSPNVSVPYGLG